MPYGQSCYVDIAMPSLQSTYSNNNGMTISEPSYIIRRKFYLALISIPAKRLLRELAHMTIAVLLLHMQNTFDGE